MFIATVIVSALLAPLLILSAYGKLSGDPRQGEMFDKLDVPQPLRTVLPYLEIAGALGLIVGLWFAAIGIAAAVGLVLYFVGAVAAHLRKGDKAIAPALVIGLVSLGVLALRIQTA